jgi:hypothetical protein
VACGFAFRRLQLRWGATPEELGGRLPGDDFITNAGLEATRSITIHAPAEKVRPWLAQMGQRRGGLYSYDFLENLAGLDIHSADRIHPEWQDIKVGDPVHLAPADSSNLEVGLLEPGRTLVLRIPPSPAPGPFDFIWAFVLQPKPDGTTRLVVRERYAYRQWWARFLVETVEVASFVMALACCIQRTMPGHLLPDQGPAVGRDHRTRPLLVEARHRPRPRRPARSGRRTAQP